MAASMHGFSRRQASAQSPADIPTFFTAHLDAVEGIGLGVVLVGVQVGVEHLVLPPGLADLQAHPHVLHP